MPNLRGIPIIIVSGRGLLSRRPTTIARSQYLTQAGVPNEFVRLADEGSGGNGHMMMLEKNSDAIAALLLGWLDRRLG